VLEQIAKPVLDQEMLQNFWLVCHQYSDYALWWCYPTPSEWCGCGGTPRRPNSRATPQDLDQRSKLEDVVPKLAHRRGVRRRCKKNSLSVLFWIVNEDKRRLWPWQRSRDSPQQMRRERPVPPKESGSRGNCEKDFVSKSSECA